MSLTKLLNDFSEREQADDILKANWYTVAAAALAASSAGPDVPTLYQLATAGLPLAEKKAVQCRLKEAILKTSCLYGVPRSLQALLPLFATLENDEIENYGPRYESLDLEGASARREKKGREYFDILWTPHAAQANRESNFRYQKDLYLLNQKMVYEWHMSEDAILSAVETQMCNTAALICSNCPVQAMWHTRGIIRHGGSMTDAHFAQELGLGIAQLYNLKTGNIAKVEDIDFEDSTPH